MPKCVGPRRSTEVGCMTGQGRSRPDSHGPLLAAASCMPYLDIARERHATVFKSFSL